MAHSNGDHSHIKGWGSDLDHSKRPAYPKERTPPRLEGIHWTEPEQQESHVKVFHSTERPGITPVYGTSVPPSGLSGLIRMGAFRLSENDVRHWLLLLLADRVNVIEGMVTDVLKSRRARVLAGSALVAAVAFAVLPMPRRRRR